MTVTLPSGTRVRLLLTLVALAGLSQASLTSAPQEAPDTAKLESVMGSLVARLAQQPGRLHIYGEMVDVLAEAGNFRGAHRLEELWNNLATKTPFDLFCGYTSAHFGDLRTAQALKAICATHHCVHTGDADDLGTFLISQSANAPEDPGLPWRFTPSS